MENSRVWTLLLILSPELRRCRTRWNESLRFFESKSLPQLVPKQQQVNAHLNNDRRNGQIPHLSDLKAGSPRYDHCRQNKQREPCHRAKERRQRVADSLENTGTYKNNSRRHEVQRDDPKVFAAEGDYSQITREHA